MLLTMKMIISERSMMIATMICELSGDSSVRLVSHYIMCPKAEFLRHLVAFDIIEGDTSRALVLHHTRKERSDRLSEEVRMKTSYSLSPYSPSSVPSFPPSMTENQMISVSCIVSLQRVVSFVKMEEATGYQSLEKRRKQRR